MESKPNEKQQKSLVQWKLRICSQGRQRISKRNEIGAFALGRWGSLTVDRVGMGWERPMSCCRLIMATADDNRLPKIASGYL